jgi:CheY-like chemotaxis protein
MSAVVPLALAAASPPHVFLVDDAVDNREVYAFYLRRCGYRVTEATQGLEAFEQMASGPTPDVLVTDILLPDIDGFELCRRIRAEPHLGSVRMIALTALPLTHQHLEKAKEVGSEVVLRKPCLPETLADEVRRVIDNARALRQRGTQALLRAHALSERSTMLQAKSAAMRREAARRPKPPQEQGDLKRRIVAEYTEMPGLSLTKAQACRLWGIEGGLCQALLDELVVEGVLRRVRGETYLSSRGR